MEYIIGTKINDPKAVAKVKEEYEKKLASMEETIAGLKGVDKKSKDEALAAFKKGDFSRARELFLKIREKERKRQQELNKEAAVTAYRLGDIAYLELDFKGALDYYLEAERLDPGNTLYTTEVGKAYYTLAKYTKAKEYFEKSLEIDLKTYGDKHPSVAIRLNNMGAASSALGEARKAISYYERALAIDKAVYGERHPNVAVELNNLGRGWGDLGEAKKAIGYYEQALAIDKEVYGERHPGVAIDLNNLGRTWGDLGEVTKAVKCLEASYGIFREFYGEDHPDTKNSKKELDSLKQSKK
jgi:tetratricopeptide (TPR) repeat protein